MDEDLNLQYLDKTRPPLSQVFSRVKIRIFEWKESFDPPPNHLQYRIVFPQASSYALLVITRSKLLSNYSKKQAP